jgi:uncharacterized protein YkwD
MAQRDRVRAPLLLACMVLPCAFVHAQGGQALIERINAYRETPGDCAGLDRPSSSPLAPSGDLDRLGTERGVGILDALAELGYAASAAKAITLSGPHDVDSAMAAILRHSCAALLDPSYSEIGASRSGTTWQVVLAQPLAPANLGDWQTAGQQVLGLVNAARAEPRECGSRRFDAARPLAWSQALGIAALAHSRDMAQRDRLSHEGSQDHGMGDRAQAAGYDWQRVGENIAVGMRSPQHAVAGWVSSPQHCSNLMDPRFTEMGAAYAVKPGGTVGIYWTQILGKPRKGAVGTAR